MWLPRHQKRPQTPGMIILLLIISSFSNQASATLSRKLDQEVLVPPNVQAPNYDVKCGACPCTNPCGQLPPPPPPLPPPSPPPPPAASPPPPPKTPIGTPPPPPPPPPRFIYVPGVPGDTYQTEVNNWYYSRAECNVAKKLLLLAGYFVLGILVI